MKQSFRILSLVVFFGAALPSGHPAESAADAKLKVLGVVQRFLDSLAARDTDACKATLSPEGQIQVLDEGSEKPKVSYVGLGEFADRIARWKHRPLERIWNPTVHLHGRIATVWAPYDFHRDGKFSHSGVDVFTLMRRDDEWRIVSLAFTMEPNAPSRHPDGPPGK